jgi:hypothetical protein
MPPVLVSSVQGDVAIFNSGVPSQELTEAGDRVLLGERPITLSLGHSMGCYLLGKQSTSLWWGTL